MLSSVLAAVGHLFLADDLAVFQGGGDDTAAAELDGLTFADTVSAAIKSSADNIVRSLRARKKIEVEDGLVDQAAH